MTSPFDTDPSGLAGLDKSDTDPAAPPSHQTQVTVPDFPQDQKVPTDLDDLVDDFPVRETRVPHGSLDSGPNEPAPEGLPVRP